MFLNKTKIPTPMTHYVYNSIRIEFEGTMMLQIRTTYIPILSSPLQWWTMIVKRTEQNRTEQKFY